MLLQHASLRPPPRRRNSPTAEHREAAVFPLVSTTRRAAHRDASAAAATDGDEDEALALLSDRQRQLARRLSKSCANIKKFGDRLYIRRRQRHAERIVIDDVERMRETLVAMDRQLSLLDSLTLSMRQNAEAGAMDMVQTYFHLMKHGLDPKQVAYDRDVTTPFLQTVMSPDLKCQDFVGLDSFFQQWEFVTKFHAGITMVNESMTVLPSDRDDVLVIRNCGLTLCRISRDTLVHFFPHILNDEELVQFLIGKQYGYGYTMVFHIDGSGKVFQFESRIDLTSGLLKLLSNPLTTLQLVESSMWTKGGNLRGGQLREQQVPIENAFLS